MKTVCLLLAVALIAGVATLHAAEIHDAALSGDAGRVSEILARDPGAGTSQNETHDTPLHIAAREGHIQVIGLLLDAGIDPDIGDYENSTALDVAAIAGHVDVAQYLMKRGADPKHQDDLGVTAMHFGAMHPGIVALLIEAGADVNVVKSNGSTPLHSVAYYGDPEAVRLLLDAGADPDVRNNALFTPFLSACAGQAGVEAIEMLIQHGADIHARGDWGMSALMYAANAGKTDVVQYLIDNGASVQARMDGSARTALHNAAEAGHIEIIELLIENGLDVDVVSDNGWTPLYWAALRGNLDAARLLIDRGADVNVSGEHGVTVLHRAFVGGHDELAALLIESGTDVDAQDLETGRSVLHGAALNGRTEFAELALNSGASVDLKDAYGMTPLQYAGKYGHKDVAELLMARGASKQGLEENYGRHELLNRKISNGEAAMWYTGHCGWAIKTKDHFLIFDYWNDTDPPPSACLTNGHIDCEEIADEDVYVFVTHEHADHFDPVVFDWADAHDNITYVFGFRPELQPQYRQDGYPGPEYIYTGPREHTRVGGMSVRTIEANDAGIGFVIDVDGLTLFHAGDHAGWADGERDGFVAEIDYLAEHVGELDVAFLNVTGCHAHDPERLKEGNIYTLERLGPRLMIPTHAVNMEYRYVDAAEELKAAGVTTKIHCPVNRGDSFVYSAELTQASK